MADSNSKKNTKEKSSHPNKGKRANVATDADPRTIQVADSNGPAPNDDLTRCAPVEVSTSPSEAASNLKKHEVGRIEISAAASPDSAGISLREGDAPEGAAGAGAAGATLSSSSSSEQLAKKGKGPPSKEGGSVRHEVVTGKSTCLPKFGVFIGLQLIPMRKRWPALCGNPCALEEFWTKSPFHTLDDQHGFKRLMEAPEGDTTAYVFCQGFEIGQEVTGVNNLMNTLLETYGLYAELARTQVAPALANPAVPIALPVAATTAAAAAPAAPAAVAAVVAVATPPSPPSEDSTVSPNPGTLRQYDPSFVGQVKAMRNKWPDVCNNPGALENFWAGSPFRTVEQRAAFTRMMKAPKTDLTVYVAVHGFRTKHDMEPVNRLMNDVLGKPRIAPHARRTKAMIADARAERALVAAAPTNATVPANIVVSRQDVTAAALLTPPREDVAAPDVHSVVSAVPTPAITLSTDATAAPSPLILGAVAPSIALLAPAASSNELELEPVFGVRLCNSADSIAATTAPDAGNAPWHNMIATNGATTDLGLTAPTFNPPAPRDLALSTFFAASAHDLFDAPPLGLASPLIKVLSYLPMTTAASVLNYAPVYETPESAAPALATDPVSTAEELLATLDSFIALASTDISQGSNSNGAVTGSAPSGTNTPPVTATAVAVPAAKAPVRGMRGPVRCQRRDTTINESADVITGDTSNTGETAAATEVAAAVVVKAMRPRAKSAPFADVSFKGMRDI